MDVDADADVDVDVDVDVVAVADAILIMLLFIGHLDTVVVFSGGLCLAALIGAGACRALECHVEGLRSRLASLDMA